MRVLWFTNDATPQMLCHANRPQGTGWSHLINELAQYVNSRTEIELGIATVAPGLPYARFDEGRVRFYVLPQPRHTLGNSMRRVYLKNCLSVVEDFRPDLIHVHGSERFFGMIKVLGMTSVPMVISVQGLLSAFSQTRRFFGALSSLEIASSLRLLELPLRIGLAWYYFDAKIGAKREAAMFAAADAVIGRTEWDKTHTHVFNNRAPYFHVGEIFRSPFYGMRWSLDTCDRYSVVYTNAGHPCRGTEDLLAALALLRREFPSIRLRLTGRISTRGGYGRFVRKRIRDLGLTDCVELLGYVNGETVAATLARSHVFAISSYVENSPNSLGEAMLVGMPCVASYVGGVPSLLSDNDTGLFFPPGDVPMLAERIRRLFREDATALRLGANAHAAACARHDPGTVVRELMATYDAVLGEHRTDGTDSSQNRQNQSSS